MSKYLSISSSGVARTSLWIILAVVALLPLQAQAQYLSSTQLDSLVSRIALYPDPLLAQVLTASTYYDQIPDAASYANRYRYLQGDDLARQIEADNLGFDPSVQALIPFPSVLDTMASDMRWTESLGSAVLDARPEVMDAIQRMRRRAHGYGYLHDCPQYRVVYSGGWVEILPVAVGALYVPVYDPYWIYARPRPGYTIGITFGHSIFIGAAFGGFGWRAPRFDWRERTWFIDNHRWERDRANRAVYVHQYREPFRGGAAHVMRGGPGMQNRPGGPDRGGPGMQNRPGPSGGANVRPSGREVQPQNRPSGQESYRGREVQQNRPGTSGSGSAPSGGREMQPQNRPSGQDRSGREASRGREMQRSRPETSSGGSTPSGRREMQPQNRPSDQDRGGREASSQRESRGTESGRSDRGERKASREREGNRQKQ